MGTLSCGQLQMSSIFSFQINFRNCVTGVPITPALSWQYQQLFRKTVTKLFADQEIKKRQLEEWDQSKRYVTFSQALRWWRIFFMHLAKSRNIFHLKFTKRKFFQDCYSNTCTVLSTFPHISLFLGS